MSQVGIGDKRMITVGPTLGENETICPHCKGIGFSLSDVPGSLQFNAHAINPAAFIKTCTSCHGLGKLDWASKITAGVKE